MPNPERSEKAGGEPFARVEFIEVFGNRWMVLSPGNSRLGDFESEEEASLIAENINAAVARRVAEEALKVRQEAFEEAGLIRKRIPQGAPVLCREEAIREAVAATWEEAAKISSEHGMRNGGQHAEIVFGRDLATVFRAKAAKAREGN